MKLIILRSFFSGPFSEIFLDSDTFYYSDIFPDSGSPQIPLESEGTAVPPISILFPLPKEEEKIRLFSEGKKDQKSEGKARFFSRAIYGEAERPNSSNLDVRDGSPQHVEETLVFFPEP